MSDMVERCPEMLKNASEQISGMAGLVETYPELLKMACDPSPLPRANWKHVVGALKSKASCILRSREYHPAYTFRYDLHPIVPTDDSLAFFLAGMTKILHALPRWLAQPVGCDLNHDADQPLKSDNSNSDGNALIQDLNTLQLSETSVSELLSGANEGRYSNSVLKDIETAVEGMAFVYTMPDVTTGIKPRVLRTR